jgi:membrane protein DedA with SNARE-associated domain
MFIDAVLPAASELVMVYAGALAAGAFASQNVVLFGQRLDSGWPAYLAVALAGTIGYTLGSIVGWAIGFYGGRPYVERHGRWLHLDEAKLARADAWFERYGDAAVLIGRITPVIRSFVAIPAGIARMPLGPYTLFTAIGSAIWCFGLAGIGWALGSSWESFHSGFRFADYAIAALVVAGVVLLLVRRRSRRRRRAAEQSGTLPG